MNMHPEYQQLQTLLQQVPFPKTIKLNMRKINKHWFLDYDYFLFREEYTVAELQGKTGYYDRELENGAYAAVNKDVLASINDSWKSRMKEQGIEIGSIQVFAWCEQIVEKDSSLFYLYDKKGMYRGIYCHSLNWHEDIVYLGQSLDEFFDVDKGVSVIDNDYVLTRKKASKKSALTYKDVLRKKDYVLLNAEDGLLTNYTFELYKQYIDAHVIPLTNKELYYTALVPGTLTKDWLRMNWQVNDKVFTFELDRHTDYLDTNRFFNKLNEILRELNTNKEIAVFGLDGHEYGLAYVDARKKKQLGELFNFNLYDLNR